MNKTVLFVSSNKTLVMFLGILIKRMGFGFVSARSGMEVLEMMSVVRPDAIMVDGDISDFTGLESLERIRAGGVYIPPVIMLVGANMEEAERRCKLVRAISVVAKPVKTEDLHFALQEAMFTGSALRRRYVRTKANIRVAVFHEGDELALTMESLSAGGAYIKHDEPLSVGTVVDIFMPLGEQECLFVTGRVIYNQKPCEEAGGLCPGFAVEFVDMGAHDLDSVREFVSALLTEDISPMKEEPSLLEREDTGVYSAIRAYSQKPVQRRKSVA